MTFDSQNHVFIENDDPARGLHCMQRGKLNKYTFKNLPHSMQDWMNVNLYTIFLYIYWIQKETLQRSLLYYFIKCDNMTFLHWVKDVRDFCEEKNSNLNPVQWSETFLCKFERFARPARYFFFRVLWKWNKLVRSKGNNPKQRKIIRNW